MGVSTLRTLLFWLVACCVLKTTTGEESSVLAGIPKRGAETWNRKDSSKPSNLQAELPPSFLKAWKSPKNASKLQSRRAKPPQNQTQNQRHKQIRGSFIPLKLKKLLAVTRTATKKSEEITRGCSSKMDIGFIMGGCGAESFEPCTSFAKTVINNLSQHHVDGHYGLILFSKRAKIIIGFEENQEQAEVMRELNAIKYKENAKLSKLKTGKALQLANDLFTNARKDSKKISLLFTGGKASDDVVVPSQQLKSSGVSIFGMGLGSEVERTQLEVIANTPSNEFVYSLDPDGVSAVTNRIITGFCDDAEPKKATFTFIMDEGNESNDRKDYKSEDLNGHAVHEYTSEHPAAGNNDDPSAYLKFLAGLNQALSPWTAGNNLDSWQAEVQEGSNKNSDEAVMKSPDYYEQLVNSDPDDFREQGASQEHLATESQHDIGHDRKENQGTILLQLSNNTLVLPLSVDKVVNITSVKEPKKVPSLEDVAKVVQNDPQQGNGNVDGSNSGNTQSTSQNNANNNAMNSGNTQGMNNGNNGGMNNGNNGGMNNGNNNGMNNGGMNNGNNEGMNNGNNEGMNNGNSGGMNNGNSGGMNNGNNGGMNNGNNGGMNNGNNGGMNNGNNGGMNNGNNGGTNNGNNGGTNNGNNGGTNNGNNGGTNNGNNGGTNNGDNGGTNNGNNGGTNNGNNGGTNNGNNGGMNNGNSGGTNNENNGGMNNGNNGGTNNRNNGGTNNGNNGGTNNGNNGGTNNGNNGGMNNGNSGGTNNENNGGMNNGNNGGMSNGNNGGMSNGNNQGGNNGNNNGNQGNSQGGGANNPQVGLLGVIPMPAVTSQGNQPNNNGNPSQQSQPNNMQPSNGGQGPGNGQQQPSPSNAQPNNGGQTNPQQGNQNPNQGQQPGGQPNGGQPSGGQPSGGQPSGGQPSGGQPSGGSQGQQQPSTSPTTPPTGQQSTASTPQPGSEQQTTTPRPGETTKPTVPSGGESGSTSPNTAGTTEPSPESQKPSQAKNGKKLTPILTLPGFMLPMPMRHPHPIPRFPPPIHHMMHIVNKLPHPDFLMNPLPDVGDDQVLVGQCQDLDPGCPSMALSGLCDRESAKYNCMASCGYCRSFVKFGRHVSVDQRHKAARAKPQVPQNYPEYNSDFLRSIITRPKKD